MNYSKLDLFVAVALLVCASISMTSDIYNEVGKTLLIKQSTIVMLAIGYLAAVISNRRLTVKLNAVTGN